MVPNEIDTNENYNEDQENNYELSDPTFTSTHNFPIQHDQNSYKYPTIAATANSYRSSTREVVASGSAALNDLDLSTLDIIFSGVAREVQGARAPPSGFNNVINLFNGEQILPTECKNYGSIKNYSGFLD